ncbi:MAG TPA: hypothetical protein VFH51_07990, partial [Myxococcota bacterium]|nr:hypothetical protein [Myxococcota bacterium]
CIMAPLKRLPAADAASTLRVSSMIDGEKAQAQLGLQVGVKAHFGIASASLQAQAASAMTQDAFSSVWVFAANYLSEADEVDFDQEVKLTGVGREAERRNAWQRECGDEFVYQIQKGAQLFVVYRLDFRSEDIKNQVEVAVGGQKTVVDVNTALRRLTERIKRRTQLSVEVYQFGGDPTRITGILTGPSADLERAEAAAKAVVTCGVENLEACETLLTNALLYATSLSEPNAFPQQIQANTNPVLYVTAPWTRFGHTATRAPLSEAIQDARLSMAMTFDRVLAAKRRVDLLLRSDWIDVEGRDELEPWATQLGYAYSRILGAVPACYDDLGIEAGRHGPVYAGDSVRRCVQAARSLEASLTLPPAQILRGAVERALWVKWQQALGGKGEDPARRVQALDDLTCGLSGKFAVCGYRGPRGAVAYVMDEALFDAWAALPPETRARSATQPVADMLSDGEVHWVDFAPHAALMWRPKTGQPPVLLAGAVLDCWRQARGAYGFPTHSQMEVVGDGGSFGLFEGGLAIYSQGARSCVDMPQPVLAAWLRQGGPRSCLKYPTSKRAEADGTLYTCFEGGHIASQLDGSGRPAPACPWFGSAYCR